MTEIKIDKNDWGFIVKGSHGQAQLFLPKKEKFDLSEITSVLFAVKTFEIALLNVLTEIASENEKDEDKGNFDLDDDPMYKCLLRPIKPGDE